MSGKALPSWWSLRRWRLPSTYPADPSVRRFPPPPPLAAPWPCSSCSCRSLAMGHADGCQPQPALGLGPQEGGQSQKGKGRAGVGAQGSALCLLSKGCRRAGLNLATGFSAGKGGWSQVTLGQQRGPSSVPQHLLMGNVHPTPPPSKSSTLQVLRTSPSSILSLQTQHSASF